MPGFEVGPLQDMVAVGAVEPRAARVWFRSERPGEVAVRWRSADGAARGEVQTRVEEDGGNDRTASVRLEGLRPDRVHTFEVVHIASGNPIGSGRFYTAPADAAGAPESVVFALMSCNMPFDEEGMLSKSALEMLTEARALLRERDVRFFLSVGDQMYTDRPPALSLFEPEHFRSVGPEGRASLFECTPEELLELFHDRYRRFWNLPEWQRLHAEHASCPIWDDHEIVDNWGSDPAHDDPKWQAIGEAARRACFDYQMLRVRARSAALPDDFDYELDYGNMAFYVMDLRSNRATGSGARIFSDAQELSLRRFLRERGDRPLLFVVLSVPLIHLPNKLASLGARVSPAGEDFSDRWATAGHQKDRDRLISLLHEHASSHPGQSVLLLSGDIHIACAHEIVWEDDTPNIHQIISSAITNKEGAFLRWMSEKVMRMNRRIRTRDGVGAHVKLMTGTEGHRENPFRGLNLSLIEVRTDRVSREASFRCELYGLKESSLARVFASDWIAAGTGSASARAKA